MKREWPPSDEAFEALLAWFSPDRAEAARELEKLKPGLMSCFTRGKCNVPDELYWETVARAANRKHSGRVADSADRTGYFYRVAKYVLLEWRREPRPDPLDVDPPSKRPDPHRELEHACLDECLKKLEEQKRNVIMRYYEETGREKILSRSKLAEEEGGRNALRIKICRMIKNLRECVSECVEHKKEGLVQ